MSWYVGKYVSTCNTCLQTKSLHQPLSDKLHPLPIADAPWDTISVDFIVKLPQSNSWDVVMAIIDSVTKCTHFIDTETTISVLETTQLYLWDVWRHYGLPCKVVSDWGSRFVAEFTHKLYWLLGIKLVATTAYHSQSDGQMGWANQELEQYIWVFTNQCQDNWVGLLSFAEFQFNNQVHSST